MQNEKDIELLQMTYAAVLADAVAQFAKKINAPAPCYLYCLDPMEGMVKGLNPRASFEVEETLWDGKKCRVLVNDNAA